MLPLDKSAPAPQALDEISNKLGSLEQSACQASHHTAYHHHCHLCATSPLLARTLPLHPTIPPRVPPISSQAVFLAENGPWNRFGGVTAHDMEPAISTQGKECSFEVFKFSLANRFEKFSLRFLIPVFFPLPSQKWPKVAQLVPQWVFFLRKKTPQSIVPNSNFFGHFDLSGDGDGDQSPPNSEFTPPPPHEAFLRT